MNQHDFLNELLAIHPELEQEYRSNHYKFSLEIIALMMELGYDSKKMAQITQLTYKDYLRLESGDTTVAEANYLEAIEKILTYKMLQNNTEFVSFKKTKKVIKSKYIEQFITSNTESYFNKTRTRNKEQQIKTKKMATSIVYSKEEIEKVFLKTMSLKSTKKRVSEKETLYQDFSFEVYKS